MKMKSVAGIICYVKDVKKTAKFYEALGFQFDKREKDHASIRLNWFWIDFQKEANLSNKGAGLFLYISAEDVDEFYKVLISKGLKPSSKPRLALG